jgi:hypothetical protein
MPRQWNRQSITIGRGARPVANLLDSLPAIKEAERRQTLSATACLSASAHPAGRARLSAFHDGSALGTHASQGATRTRLRGASAFKWRGYPAGVRPGSSEHLACRS